MNQPGQNGLAQPRLSDEEFERLVQDLRAKLGQIEGLPESVRDRILDLLRHLDLMHREGLRRILVQVDENAPEVRERLLRDPAVQTLLLLYELAPEVESGAQQEALDPLISLEGGHGD